jgi:F-type H+-transporting ATPase subunit delta
MKSRKHIRRDAKRIFRLCLADGALDETRVRTVVNRLAESSRRDRFALLAQFHRLVYLECQSHTAIVESSSPLPENLAARVQADLVRTYGRNLTISFAQTPALIGGMRIRVGSDVYDDSVRRRLAALESSF